MKCGDALEIRLLGPFDARIGANPLPHLRTRKGQHLLAMLALRMGREVQREWLAANLWPESAESKSYYNLRRTLFDLRTALGPAHRFLTAPTPHSLRLENAMDVYIDTVCFERLMGNGDGKSLEEAVALYRGPLLEGWLEDWIETDREALQQTCLKALDGLADNAAERRDWQSAARWLRRLIALDPFQEDAQQRLMQALASNGDHASATLAYREFRLLIRRDLNAEPAAETADLFLHIQREARISRSRAERVYARAADAGAARYPAVLTSFIGRVDERRRVRSLLDTTRLLTLAGVGGCGKTRLALEVAIEAESDFDGRIVWVDLAPLNRSDMVWGTLATVLEIRVESGIQLSEAVLQFLADGKRLLVLDNCEHLLDGVGSMVAAILQRCPFVRILATSREPLNIMGEVTFRVPSLSVPEWTVVHSANIPALMEYEAVRLFAERAAEADTEFTVTEKNASAIAKVCCRLDGMPLAIEIAASRVGALTIEQIEARLNDRFGLLKWNRRDVQPRQQTLRSLIDWSYDLLTGLEQTLFRRLSVFNGGFTLKAAEAVCAAGGFETTGASDARKALSKPRSLPRNGRAYSRIRGAISDMSIEHSNLRMTEDLTTGEVFELLSRLVDKSLIVFDRAGQTGRYRMLETIREYALERLNEVGDENSMRARHREYFLAMAEKTPGYSDLQRWLDLLEIEQGNFGAALDISDEDANEGQSALRLCAAMRSFWFHRGRYLEGRDRCEAALSQHAAPLHNRERARVLSTAGIMALQSGDSDAATNYHGEALRIWLEVGDRREIAYAIHELAIVECEQGNFSEAWRLNEESLEIFRELGDQDGIADLLSGMGMIAFNRGDYHLARSIHEESLAMRRALGQWWGIGFAMAHLAAVLVEIGEYPQARSYGSEGMSVLWKHGEPAGVAWCLDSFGIMASRTGDPERGARLMASAARIRKEIGAGIPPGERARYDRGLLSASEPMGEQAFATAWAEGLRLTDEQAMALALP